MLLRLRTRLSALLLALGLAAPALASHIVGGEFTMTYVRPQVYDIKLTLYFDALSGMTGAIDPAARAFIYPINDPTATPVQVLMPLQPGITYVSYTNPECENAVGSVKTRILTYTTRKTLPYSQFSDAGGYYLVYERCCRNGAISNIRQPGATGQAFYMEFPPLIRSVRIPPSPVFTNDTIVNSSPALFRPLSDFACIDQPFTFDFSGRDADGDSLAYSLVEPYAGFTGTDAPGGYPQGPAPFTPAPYPPVHWAAGYSATAQITGFENLSIDARTGILRMTPGALGLFVFAIECREYRNGVYLGKVRREFQVVVRDCPRNTPPNIVLRDNPITVGQPGQQVHQGDTVALTDITSLCYPLQIRDSLPDTEVLSVASLDLPAFIDVSQPRGNTSGGVYNTQLCIDPCLVQDTVQYGRFILRVRDNACAIPLRDSLLFVLRIPAFPYGVHVTGGAGFFLSEALGRDTVIKTGPVSIEAFIADSATPVTYQSFITPALAGVSVVRTGTDRRQRLTLNFNIPCEADTSLVYTLTVIGSSSRCNATSRDTIRMRFRVRRDIPDLLFRLTDATGQPVDSGRLFNVQAGQSLVLTGTSQLTNLSPVSITADSGGVGRVRGFTPASGPGIQTANLDWLADCADILHASADSGFILNFYAHAEECRTLHDQRISIRVKVFRIVPDLLFSVADAAGLRVDSGRRFTLLPGQGLNLVSTGQLTDASPLSLTADSAGSTLPLRGFTPASGPGVQTATLNWVPICADALRPQADTGFTLNLYAHADECGTAHDQRLAVKVLVKDAEGGPARVPNVITYQSNPANEYFRFSDPLPVENCSGRFEGVDIFNQWGRKVYHSDDIRFAWKPDDGRAGLFYYRLSYQGQVTRGWVEATGK